MRYNIKFNDNIPNGVEMQSDFEVLNVFFHSFSTEQLVDLMLCLMNNEGYIGDPKGLILYHELDAEDIATGNIFEQNEIKVYHHYFGEKTLRKNLFIKILTDYLKKVKEKNTNIKFNDTLKKFMLFLHTY